MGFAADVPQDCFSCRENADPQSSLQTRFVRTPAWRVAHAFDVALPGWLVVLPRRHVTAMAQLTADEAGELGALLQRLSVALEQVTGCVKTYVMQFAEAPGYQHLHVHLVPRQADIPPDRRGPRVFGYLGVPPGQQIPQSEIDRVVDALVEAMAGSA